MPWYIYALLASLLFATIPLQKRKYGHNQRDIMFWSSLFAFSLTIVLFPILEFPKNNLFYLGAIFTGITAVFSGVMQFKLSDQSSGRVFAVQTPLQILFCFVFYCVFQTNYYYSLVESPIGTLIMAISLIVLIGASQFLRKKNDISIKVALSILPVSLLFAVVVVYYKMMMDLIPGQISNIILSYIMIHYLTISLCFLIENLMNKGRVINISEKLTSNALMIAVLYVFSYYFMFTAVYYSVNPALAISFYLLVPVWIKLYSLVIGREDDANLKALVLILISIAAIIVST